VVARKSRKVPTSDHPVSTTPSAADAQQGIERPRVSMGEALRSRGMDETALAQRFVGAVITLGGKNESGDGVAKLYVDLLKECSRHLGDDAAPSAGAPARESRVIINLIHNVRRPDRSSQTPALPAAASPAAESAALPGDAESES
jgi:hypothetical protein